ncbi:MAG: hypothetical protein HZA51_12325 [Planctomycetes bacterium]|nr:hypothetical protein [Planctomycetota bacterium]
MAKKATQLGDQEAMQLFTTDKVPPGFVNVGNELQKLEQRFPHINWDATKPYYAVPAALLQALDRVFGKKCPPNISFDFEAAFADLCKKSNCIGFWFGQPLIFEYLGESVIPFEPIPHDLIAEWHKQNTIASEKEGPPPSEESLRSKIGTTEQAMGEVEIRRQAIFSRLQGYLGWLMTNKTFIDERDELRRKWENRIMKDRAIPTLLIPHSSESLESFGVKKADVTQSEMYESFRTFYQRWCLQGFCTWDLPVPVGPQIPALLKNQWDQLAQMGNYLFLPHSLIVIGEMGLEPMAKSLLEHLAPGHLQEWRRQSLKLKRKPLGSARLGRLFRLNFYWELLKSRVGGNLKGNIGRLEEVLGQFLSPKKPGPEGNRPGLEDVQDLRGFIKSRLAG